MYINTIFTIIFSAGDFMETERIQSCLRDQTVQSSQES